MTLNDLSIPPAHFESPDFLSDWRWLLADDLRPVMVTRMGCVFVQGDSGAVGFLDPAEARAWEIAKTAEEFEELLGQQEFVMEYFHVREFLACKEACGELEQGQCYGHKHPLIVGGEDAISNLEPTEVSVHVAVHGQIHEQVKDLPEGTAVNLTIEGEEKDGCSH